MTRQLLRRGWVDAWAMILALVMVWSLTYRADAQQKPLADLLKNDAATQAQAMQDQIVSLQRQVQDRQTQLDEQMLERGKDIAEIAKQRAEIASLNAQILDLRKQLADAATTPPVVTPPPVQPPPVIPSAGTPSIVSSGMAPATIHVDAWDLVDPLKAPASITLTGPGGFAATMPGANAAWHVEKPGEYTAEVHWQGKVYRATETLVPDSRRVVTVKPGGNIGDAIDDNTRVIVEGTHLISANTIGVHNTNVQIVAATTGATLIKDAKTKTFSSIFTVGPKARHVVIDGFAMKSTMPPDTVAKPSKESALVPGNGARLAGLDVTVRRCTFGKVDTGINCNTQPSHVLFEGNVSDPIAYTVWGDGGNLVLANNIVHDAPAEHCFRINGKRINIFANDLTRKLRNVRKTTLAVQTVDQITVIGNTFHIDPAGIGPLDSRDATKPDVRAANALFENNTFDRSEFQINPGTTRIVVRGNKLVQLKIRPWSPVYHGWTVRDVLITGNVLPKIFTEPPLPATETNARKYGTTIAALEALPTSATDLVIENNTTGGSEPQSRAEPRLIQWYIIGFSAADPANRNVGRNLADGGWPRLVREGIQPIADAGIPIILHNPFGALSNERMQFSQYQQAKDAGLAWLIDDFAESWKPITDKVEVIGYVGAPEAGDKLIDSAADESAREQLIQICMKPLLDAGIHPAIDAASAYTADSRTARLMVDLRDKGHEPCGEAIGTLSKSLWLKPFRVMCTEWYWIEGHKQAWGADVMWTDRPEVIVLFPRTMTAAELRPYLDAGISVACGNALALKAELIQ